MAPFEGSVWFSNATQGCALGFRILAFQAIGWLTQPNEATQKQDKNATRVFGTHPNPDLVRMAGSCPLSPESFAQIVLNFDNVCCKRFEGEG